MLISIANAVRNAMKNLTYIRKDFLLLTNNLEKYEAYVKKKEDEVIQRNEIIRRLVADGMALYIICNGITDREKINGLNVVNALLNWKDTVRDANSGIEIPEDQERDSKK